LTGKIEVVEFGGVMAHVTIRMGKDIIESVLTKRSVEEMKLKVQRHGQGRHEVGSDARERLVRPTFRFRAKSSAKTMLASS